MCGIALIISGIKIDLSLLFPDYTCLSAQYHDPVISYTFVSVFFFFLFFFFFSKFWQ